jgi:hypothetical protein
LPSSLFFFLQPIYCAYWYLITACILPDCHTDPPTDKTDERKRGKTERQTDIQIERKKMRERKSKKGYIGRDPRYLLSSSLPPPPPTGS